MANSFFQFKHFTIHQDKSAMKVSTDACLFGAWIANQNLQHNLLDIGTGTGLLACIIAQKHNNITIDAIEKDTDSFQQAKENILQNNFTNINIIHSNFFNYNTTSIYTSIVCNPPFYNNHLKAQQTNSNTAKHFNTASFNLLYNKIYKLSSSITTIYILLSAEQYQMQIQLMNQNKLFVKEIVFIKHKASHRAIRVFLKATTETTSTKLSEICIKNENDTYTTQFCKLLQDYYLAL